MITVAANQQLSLPSGIFSQMAEIVVYFSIFKKTMVKFKVASYSTLRTMERITGKNYFSSEEVNLKSFMKVQK